MKPQGISGKSNAAQHVLVLTRNIEAAACITFGLQGRFAVDHFTSLDQALTERRLPGCIAAFVDCVMPTSIFRAIRSAGQAGRIRVIGIRDKQASHRPLELLAQHLIAAYISVPVTLSVVGGLICEIPGQGISRELRTGRAGVRNQGGDYRSR